MRSDGGGGLTRARVSRGTRRVFAGGGRLAAAVAVAVVLAACSGGSPASTTTQAPTQSTTQTTTAAASAGGCGKSVTTGSSTLSLTVGGRARVVIVHVPSSYTGSQKVALVLNMHGSGSDAVEQEAFTDMDAASDADGFIVAYPQGLIPEGTGYDWNVPDEPLVGGSPVPAGAANDVSFLADLVSGLETRYCVDRRRVYATGFSGGARMSSQLACDESGIFAAVAPVSGLRRPSPCPTSRAVSVIAFHGTADPVDPYDGHGQAYWTYSVPQALEDWARQDGCSSTPVVTQPAATVTLTRYGGCRDGAVVELYTIAGEGHEWPGGPHLPRALTRVLGPQSTAISADSLIWSFFGEHSLP